MGFFDDQNKDLTIAALMESNELLGEDNARYRRSNALLRRINSDLRRLKNIQAENDEEFKSMCQGDIGYHSHPYTHEGHTEPHYDCLECKTNADVEDDRRIADSSSS